MKRRERRIACINDMSCFGKCSLTVALPVISALGAEAAVLPTAVLSTHTGGFKGFTKLDMTREVERIIDHWSALDLHFDGIYTGYFSNTAQIELAERFIDRFKGENTAVIVDPVMADNGSFYSGFDESFADAISRLVKRADIITPNVTEAFLLANLPYVRYQDDALLKGIEERLMRLGARRVAITGVQTSPNSIGYRYFDGKDGFDIEYKKLEGVFHGCGDVFASALCGHVLRGTSYAHAVRASADFAEHCIEHTVKNDAVRKYGLCFEECLGELTDFYRGMEETIC